MTYLIKNAQLVNRGKIQTADILIKAGRIERIDSSIQHPNAKIIDAEGLHALPGIIDDQVHFREPGLTHKACIQTESRAAVAGGVTSFMEMPNTKPQSVTQERLEEKYQKAARVSPANYSFFMGATNDNLEEVLRTNPENVCGIKAFMGSSTGNMLVDNPVTLEKLFANCPMLIATHCEDEETVRRNLAAAQAKYGDDIPVEMHPIIRNEEACYKSSSLAVELAKKHQTRLHILHLTTKDELDLFDNSIPLAQKHITSELCVHHLYFNADDYAKFGTQIKCNPAVKAESHRAALLEALLDDRLDIIATDHAPHTWDEKQGNYMQAPSGVPLVQHSLNVMLEFYHRGEISLEKIVEKMAHAPATCFRVKERGFLDEGYWADIALVDLNEKWTVQKDNILYRCNWSPFEGHEFTGRVRHTFVSGHLAWSNGQLNESQMGQRLAFTAR